MQKATTTKEETERAGIKEKIQLAELSAMVNKNVEIDYDLLKEALTNEFGTEGADNWEISNKGTTPWTVTVHTSNLGDVTYEITSGKTISTVTDESEKLYNAIKDKTPQEIMEGVNVDGINTNFIDVADMDAFIEYNNQVYIISLNPNDGSVSTVNLSNIDLTKFGIQKIGSNNFLITPSTPNMLIHADYIGPTTFSDTYYYKENEVILDHEKPFTEGYKTTDNDGSKRYYDTLGAIVHVGVDDDSGK